MQRAFISLFFSTLPLVTLSCLIPLTAEAQISADGTTSTKVNQNGNDFTIEQGSRVDDNLFHSFNEFSVPTGGSAAFNNASDIANIFSRVTGSNISSIDGLISANGAANLFLINPNGIIFGENARLDLGGSFFASTADSLLFEGNKEFSASNPQTAPLLEVSIPIGINFRDNPGDIVNRSVAQNSTGDIVGLEVATGENLTLVGGNINFEAGNTTARGGDIELGGLSEAGTVTFNDDGSLNFPEDVAQADIFFNGFADVDIRGTGGGSITINARNLSLEAGDLGRSRIRAGITEDSTSAEAQAGDITVNVTENITVDESFINNQVNQGALGNAGGVAITTGSLTLTNGGQVNASTSGRGDAGSVLINASDTIDIDDADAGVFSEVQKSAEGNAGGITINTSSLSVTGGQVNASTSGRGDAGSVLINASDAITFDGEDSDSSNTGASSRDIGAFSQVGLEAVGDAGDVTIKTRSLSLTNGVRVNTSTFGRGDAGDVTIKTRSLSLTNRGRVTATTSIFSQGDAGDVTIKTGSLSMSNFGIVSTITGGQGNGGSVEITASDTIDIDDSSGVFSRTFNTADEGAGDAGDVTIKTGSLSLTNGGRVDASTFGRGDGGSVEITATDLITLDGDNSFIHSQVNSEAEGDAGDVTITTGSLSLTNGGQVGTSTFGLDNAGTLNLTTKDLTVEKGAQITASTNSLGNGGNLNINVNKLIVREGGEIQAGSLLDSDELELGTDRGTGGTLNINATESVEVTGIGDINGEPVKSTLNTLAESNGDAGDLNLTTGNLTVSDGAEINASAIGEGNAGDIKIRGNSIDLTNGSITASTNARDGGNISLNIDENLTLRDNSLISARAFEEANGGNIDINAEFIIAFPSQPPENGNDIVANAEQGIGGNINIATQFLFGLQVRPATEGNGTNDIDASSEFGLESQGDISVNTPEVDPTSNLIELPEEVGDVSDQIAQNPCEQGVGSEFFITGKGGLRPNPHETLSSDRVPVTLVEPVPSKQEDGETRRQGDGETRRRGDGEMESSETSTPEAVPAQGWIFTDTGEVMLTSYIPSAMAEVTPPTPVAQTSTNPSQLATQAEKLYQNQEFDAAAAFWEQAAQAFAVSGDNLNQAMALSNLSLTYQHLGKWENANQAIQDSLTALNAAPENSHLVAQTLDIQGKLQRETGQPAAAIDTWQKAANIYQKLDKSAALTQNNLNQAQAFQDLGLYTRACKTVLASLEIENIAHCQDSDRLTTKEKEELDRELDKITAQPSLQKVLGLRRLGDLLLLIGQPQKSRQILATSLTLAKQLNSPSEIAATYLSMGKTAHSFTTKEAERSRTKRKENQQQALEAYRQAIAISPDLITQQQAKLNQFSLLLQIKQWSEAAALGQEILTQIANLPPSHSNVFAQINFAHSLIELLNKDKPQPPAEIKFPSVREIERILTKAIANAQTLGDNRLEAYALGDRGRLYELTGQLALAEQYTQQAIALISTLDSADIAYQYLWQLGRIQNRQGELEKAISAYTKAYNALQSLRSDLATINPEVQFSFRDEVEPVYRELVGLNFKYVQTLANKQDKQEEITAKLIQARDLMESLQLSQLNNFFREACIEANPQQIDKIDRNAAVIYTIVLPDKLGILLSLPNRPPMLYPVDVTQAEISEAVKTMRRSLKTSSIPVAKTLPESQKIYDWLIRPLEAELAKNEVKTIAFVLDDDLRNIPMAVLHDGKQYLVEKYALALTSGLQLLDPKPLTAIELNAIAAGLSKSQDDSDVLPGVAAELQAMQAIGLTDRYLLNEKFTKQALKQNIADSSSPILHLATLAQFSPKAEDTFILTWGDRINIKEFADLLRFSTFKRKNAIELLVLSAGETAAGDSRASLGLAGVALQAGVRSTLATVWPVVDVSTAKIMERFYLELKEASKTKVNKAEALRQAQLALIKDKQFNHPHYWAPFILIGNWQ